LEGLHHAIKRGRQEEGGKRRLIDWPSSRGKGVKGRKKKKHYHQMMGMMDR